MATLNGRKVVDLEVDGIDLRDSPDFSDAYFSYACYEDGTELTDDELEQLTEQNANILHEKVFDSLH